MKIDLDHKIILCPSCKDKFYTPYEALDRTTYKTGISPPPPALSRRNNETYICTECGWKEAMEDFSERYNED